MISDELLLATPAPPEFDCCRLRDSQRMAKQIFRARFICRSADGDAALPLRRFSPGQAPLTRSRLPRGCRRCRFDAEELPLHAATAAAERGSGRGTAPMPITSLVVPPSSSALRRAIRRRHNDTHFEKMPIIAGASRMRCRGLAR